MIFTIVVITVVQYKYSFLCPFYITNIDFGEQLKAFHQITAVLNDAMNNARQS